MRKKIAIPGESASPMEQARTYVVDTGLYMSAYIKLIGDDFKLIEAMSQINKAVALVSEYIDEKTTDATERTDRP